MKILFLSNNLDVTKPLYDWLVDQGKSVLCYQNKINANFILDNDIFFIISYNYLHMIRPDVLSLLPHRVVNLHISLLPWNRGADPNIWSFINNTPCGVTIHEVDVGLDTGDILLQEQVYFDYSRETLKSSYFKLQSIIQDLFKMNSEQILNGSLLPVVQTGEGSFHLKKELLLYQDTINFDDTISNFISKINLLGNITPPRSNNRYICFILFFNNICFSERYLR